MLASRVAVTTVIVTLNGVEQERLTGLDLRTVAGSYFSVPPQMGIYQLEVEAVDANGCSDVSDRSMTVTVK